jgi:hypothetical protein
MEAGSDPRRHGGPTPRAGTALVPEVGRHVSRRPGERLGEAAALRPQREGSPPNRRTAPGGLDGFRRSHVLVSRATDDLPTPNLPRNRAVRHLRGSDQRGEMDGAGICVGRDL